MDEREAKLPVWARELIAELRLRPKILQERTVELELKVRKLEEHKRKQQDRIDAMVAMFQCAAKGGNEVAQAVQRIVEDFLVSDEV